MQQTGSISKNIMLSALLTKTIWYWYMNGQTDHWDRIKVQKEIQVHTGNLSYVIC